MITTQVNRYLIAGSLKQVTILPYNRPPIINQLGGNLIHAAAGVSLWDTGVGLISRVGNNFPRDWLATISSLGWDTTGIRQLPQELDHRTFFSYEDAETLSKNSPIDQFSAAGLPFPKELIGYQSPPDTLDSRLNPSPFSLKANDIPSDYLDATAVHLCPLDFLSHTLLPPIFRHGHISTITIEPGPSYMHPTFLDSISGLLSGITAFLPSESIAHSLFQGRTSDLVEISEELGSAGCEIIVIQRGSRGCLVYDHRSHSHWIIPAYPSQMVIPTGSNDAFCGGFLAGFRQSYDPLTAALYATISRSFCVESIDPVYMLNVMPRLAQARLDSLRSLVRKM
jgi:sugar/nucleoside kinase (ribokinase family)